MPISDYPDEIQVEMRQQVAMRPRFRFACERNLLLGPDVWSIGFVWDRNFDADFGEYCYLHRLLINIRFRLWLDRL